MKGPDFSGQFRSRVRPLRQTEAAECGVVAIAMVANYHGLDIDLSVLRRHHSPSMRGTSLRGLMTLADTLGLMPRPVRAPLNELPNLALPAILHWNLNHYVVVERFRRSAQGVEALIHDPSGPSRWMTLAQISDHFTGVALELRPSQTFQKAEVRERLKLSQLWQRLTGVKRAFGQTLILTLALQVLTLAAPYYMQLALDGAVPSDDKQLLNVLAVGFALLALVTVGTAALRSFVLLNISSAVGYGIRINVARKLLRINLAWFERRQVGDILSRFQSVTPVQQLITSGTLSIALDGFMALFTVAVMFAYSAKLALISVLAFSGFVVVRWLTYAMQRKQQEADIVTDANTQTLMIESIRGVATLRAFGKETERHALWQSSMVDTVNASLRLSRIGIVQTAASAGLYGLENIAIIWIAVGLVIDGQFSIGMIYAFIAYKATFQTSATALANQAFSFRMLDLHLERLGDVALAEDDPSFAEPLVAEKAMSGRIELRNIVFRYGPSEATVLKGLDLVVEAGEHVAITGPSGGGKSTLVKMLLALADPESGELLIDGQPLPHFGYRNYRSQVAAVLQNDSLFSGSIASNIALFDDDPDQERVMAAAQAAAIHDDVLAMSMQYETLIGEMGASLSGGQKQRLFLARALYRQPRVLIVDEGTSHLDPAREALVNAAIRSLNITRIVVAHRRETVAAADRVLRLEGGVLSPV